MELVKIKGGEFLMGDSFAEGFEDDLEGPPVKVRVEDFAIGKFPVTNEEFLEFFKETGYITEAEVFGSSFVFDLFLDKAKRDAYPRASTDGRWLDLRGASWRRPLGEGSSIRDIMDHPVVHISYNDALAFAKWKDLRLPTEAEWEYAARAGSKTRFPWGDELIKDGKYMANTYQGDFPKNLRADDGYKATAPVKSYKANAFGLYQVCGNVYEWTINDGKIPLEDFRDHPRDYFFKKSKKDALKSMRGGSFLCSPDYCKRYRVASRNSTSANSSAMNIGFRLARSL